MAEKTKKSFVMEIADLQHDRRETTFDYGEHTDIPIAYNPGAFSREAADREDEQDDLTRRDVLIQALDDVKVERFLGAQRGSSYVTDPDGMADYLMDAMIKEFRRRRDAVIDTLADGLLLEWPIVRNGEPVAITRDEMLSLPYFYLASMYAAIMDDMTPGKNSLRGRDRARRR